MISRSIFPLSRSRDFQRHNIEFLVKIQRSMSSRLLYSCRMTGNDNKAPLAKISLSDSVRRGTSPSSFDLLCFHVHTAIPFPQIRFLLVSRVNKTDVVSQMRLRN